MAWGRCAGLAQAALVGNASRFFNPGLRGIPDVVRPGLADHLIAVYIKIRLAIGPDSIEEDRKDASYRTDFEDCRAHWKGALQMKHFLAPRLTRPALRIAAAHAVAAYAPRSAVRPAAPPQAMTLAAPGPEA